MPMWSITARLTSRPAHVPVKEIPRDHYFRESDDTLAEWKTEKWWSLSQEYYVWFKYNLRQKYNAPQVWTD